MSHEVCPHDAGVDERDDELAFLARFRDFGSQLAGTEDFDYFRDVVSISISFALLFQGLRSIQRAEYVEDWFERLLTMASRHKS